MARAKTFEEAMLRLEEVVDRLDGGDIPLEETIKLYKEGMEMYEFCQKKLQLVEGELKLLVVNPEEEEPEEENRETEE
ncbi:MAG: exodeoxyribonuclease VII small subunit [Candidatus Delongbacteria bacterium]|nr:exodeoxyribonuclease VII small subunit [Candidatus Delongbacteria bacterium]